MKHMGLHKVISLISFLEIVEKKKEHSIVDIKKIILGLDFGFPTTAYNYEEIFLDLITQDEIVNDLFYVTSLDDAFLVLEESQFKAFKKIKNKFIVDNREDVDLNDFKKVGYSKSPKPENQYMYIHRLKNKKR